MNGGSRTVTTNETQTRTPYAPAVPALQTIIDGGLAAYNSGVGSRVYQGDRTAGPSNQTLKGWDFLKKNAGAGLAGARAGDSYLTGLLGQGGATDDIAGAVQGLLGVRGIDTSGIQAAAARMGNPNGAAAQAGRALAGGTYNLDASGYEELNAGLAGPTQAQRSLQGVADGQYLGGANPHLDQIIARSQGEAANRVAQQFAASGRYGSGRFAGATQDAAQGIATNLRYQDYEAERGRQAQAAQAIDAGLLARTGARQGLLGAINDTRTANAGQLVQGATLAGRADADALTGAQALAEAQRANNAQRIGQYTTALQSGQADRAAAMSGLAAVPGIQEALLQPGRTLLGVGREQTASQQLDIAARMDRFNEEQQAPWRQLGLLSELVNPVAAAGGTSTGSSTQKVPQPGLLQQILGLALAGADTASKFYGR